MNLNVQREASTANSTPGQLFVDGVFQCYTLEDVVRERRYDDGSLIDPTAWKIQGKTAIPSGRYKVIIDFSFRFNRLMPHILNVAGFDGIRIHSGNTAADTSGCILLGSSQNGADQVLQSRLAFDKFFGRLRAVPVDEQIFIELENPIGAPGWY